MAVVYQHRRNDTNKVFYIGIGNSKSRAYSINNRNKHWLNIVNKFGYSVDVLIEGFSFEEAKIVEIGMISDYGRLDINTGCLVNMTNGGDSKSGYIMTEDTKRKISEKARNRPGRVWTEESKIKLSNTNKGKAPVNKGGRISEEIKKRISEKLTGRKLSEETKQKMRKPKTEEHKMNIKKSKKPAAW
jgi:hypothetical protein